MNGRRSAGVNDAKQFVNLSRQVAFCHVVNLRPLGQQAIRFASCRTLPDASARRTGASGKLNISGGVSR